MNIFETQVCKKCRMPGNTKLVFSYSFVIFSARTFFCNVMSDEADSMTRSLAQKVYPLPVSSDGTF